MNRAAARRYCDVDAGLALLPHDPPHGGPPGAIDLGLVDRVCPCRETSQSDWALADGKGHPSGGAPHRRRARARSRALFTLIRKPW